MKQPSPKSGSEEEEGRALAMDTCRRGQMLSEASRGESGRYRRGKHLRSGEVQKRREGPGLSWEERPRL